MRFLIHCAALLSALGTAAAPVFLDDQFELPPGFRIYRAAEKDLTGGSYALRFDGQGRLLVADGTALRRLQDKDNDGVFDAYEVIATGLGWRGPQGILVYGDRLFAVGGDGIQLYEGYTNGPLKHVGRVGARLNTGGDHDAHTLLRGHDGFIYFMAGNGSGLTNRSHITVANSPARIAREATVFRISPDGQQWESIAIGGRNPPSLGMNYLGDLFSFDSDMEWHVGLPWYRPVRLNHWVIGGDQGWQEVGAYPPYYIDNLPGILNVGRGSPNWGVFYEHRQFPEKYRNAFFVCDYRWKSESTDDYQTTGRLVAFHLSRSGSRWDASMETFARPRPGAKDAAGRSIPFALVDVDVAPDGSIYFTDHNQGIWRILHEPAAQKPQHFSPLDELLELPQPGSEWSRLQEEQLLAKIGPNALDQLVAFARASNNPHDRRLRAIRLLAPRFDKAQLAQYLWTESHPEIRAQAAWLAGLAGGSAVDRLPRLLKDSDPFVRRRAAEGLMRHVSLRFLPEIQAALDDEDRTVRYTAMMLLTHLPTQSWFERITTSGSHEAIRRALTAAALREEKASPDVFSKLLLTPDLLSSEANLDLLRVIALYQPELAPQKRELTAWLRRGFPTANAEINWERAKLLAAFDDWSSFPLLLRELLNSKDQVRQFHYFQSLAKLKGGWTRQSQKELMDWVLATQKGWFAEFAGKGVEFPLFLQTAIEEFATHHREAVLSTAEKINVESLLGGAWLGLQSEQKIIALYREGGAETRLQKILQAARRFPTDSTAAFLRGEARAVDSPVLKQAAVASLKAMPKSPENDAVLRELVAPNKRERSDEEIHKAILDASLDSGDERRGRRLYERLLCNTCHAGGQTPGQEGRIFGPDLVGVTARLTRSELADALVYPSKQVADRFKAIALSLKDGRELTGFVTERSADHVTFADATTIHRLGANEIEKSAPQEKSLMPDGLLRSLADQEIAHLIKFLNTIGTK